MKVLFKKGAWENELSYPVDQTQLDGLIESYLTNPCVGKSHGLKPFDFTRQEEYTREVLQVRAEVVMSRYPHWFMEKYNPFPKLKNPLYKYEISEPLLSQGLTILKPKKLANIVHMDLPTDAPNACLKWLLDKGYEVKEQDKRYFNFLENVMHPIENIADGAKSALKKGFEAKYYFGVGRPEEVLVVMGYKNTENFTHYMEGCPTHPSYPAGHGCAVAGGVRRLIDAFDLDEDGLNQLLLTAYQWAMFRSFAGVHYAVDNVAGLAIGGLGKYFTKEAKEIYLV